MAKMVEDKETGQEKINLIMGTIMGLETNRAL